MKIKKQKVCGFCKRIEYIEKKNNIIAYFSTDVQLSLPSNTKYDRISYDFYNTI